MVAGKPAILVVDDNRSLRESLAAALFDAGYTVRLAVDGVSALADLRDFKPDVLLSDLNMPGMGGCELLSIVRCRFPAIRSVAMSGACWSNEVPEEMRLMRSMQRAFDPLHGSLRFWQRWLGRAMPVRPSTNLVELCVALVRYLRFAYRHSHFLLFAQCRSARAQQLEYLEMACIGQAVC